MNEKNDMEAKTPEGIFDKFSKMPDFEHIGGRVSVAVISDLCRKEKIETVLEMGAGLGTLTYTVLSSCDAKVDTYEHNPRFIEKFKVNLASFMDRITILTDYKLMPPRKSYDLIIVDGGDGHLHDGGFVRAICLYLLYIDSVRFIWVDGHRKAQNTFIKEAVRQRYVYNVVSFQGNPKGGTLYRLRPEKSFLKKELLYWKHKILGRLKR